MRLRYPGVSAAVALALLSVGAAAQRFVPSPEPAVVPEKLKGFVPVTEEMLLRPRPENWISFRNGYCLVGLQPARPDQPGQRRPAAPGLVEGDAAGAAGSRADRLRRDHVSRQLGRHRPGARRHHRRSALGIPAQAARRHRKPDRTRFRYRNVSIYDDKIFLATNDAFIRSRSRPERARCCGRPSEPTTRIRSPRRQVRSSSRASSSTARAATAEPASGRVFHHRPRRQARRGAVARCTRRPAG